MGAQGITVKGFQNIVRPLLAASSIIHKESWQKPYLQGSENVRIPGARPGGGGWSGMELTATQTQGLSVSISYGFQMDQTLCKRSPTLKQ